MPTLVIANKTYSSWSMRPWLMLKELGVAFDEVMVPLDEAGTSEKLRRHSPSAKAPTYIDGETTVWDSLAIMEYLSERYGLGRVWPADPAARVLARCLSAEMHSGFGALRSKCPMNLGKHYAFRDRGPEVTRDATRIVEAWRDARARFGRGGPFLFGTFTAADAMFAPVVTRFDTYGFTVEPDIRAYMDSVLGLASFREWRAAALAETWSVRADEVDETPLADHRAPA